MSIPQDNINDHMDWLQDNEVLAIPGVHLQRLLQLVAFGMGVTLLWNAYTDTDGQHYQNEYVWGHPHEFRHTVSDTIDKELHYYVQDQLKRYLKWLETPPGFALDILISQQKANPDAQ